MMDKPDEKLLDKFLNNSCTPEESNTVLTWLSSFEGQTFAGKQFDKDISILDSGDQKSFDHPVRSIHMFQQILQKINSQDKIAPFPGVRRLYQNWLKIAAAIFIPLLITNAVIWAILEKPKGKIAWSEVYVPKGEKLQVMFQDGTKIWLNSDTRLKYPVEFSGNQRQVKVNGEAYFVVKKDTRKPFIVQLNDMDIKVTGTSFNVKAYKDENTVTTTLDEGEIYLQTRHKNDRADYLLKPGQQASYEKASSKVLIVSTIVGQNSLWKENKIQFRDTPLKEVMKVLERWYNVKFEIEDSDFPEYTYSINFQNESLQNVLFGLEKITPIRCQLKDGIVKIRKTP